MIMTTRKRHTPDQVVRKRAQVDRMGWARARTSLTSAANSVLPSRPVIGGVTQFGGLQADAAEWLKEPSL